MIGTDDASTALDVDRAGGTRTLVAAVLAVVGAALTALGGMLGVIDSPPAFASWWLLLLTALPTVAVVARFRGDDLAGALAVLAAVEVGRTLVDLQFLVDPTMTARPELARLSALSPPPVTAGFWVVVAGHACVIAAGLLVLGAVTTEPREERTRFAPPALAGAVAAVGLAMTPFGSDDAFVPVRAALDAPGVVLAGGLLLVVLVPVIGVVAASSARPEGPFAGLAAALVALALPPLVSGFVVDGLHVGFAPFLLLVAAAVFLLPQRPAVERDLALPGPRRLHVAAAVLGLLAAAGAVVGALTDQLVLPAGLPAPVDFASRPLWPAAVLVATGALVLLGNAAARPALIVSLAAVPLAAVPALDAVASATRVASVQAGAGAVFAALSVVVAAAAAVVGAVAGAVEREEADASVPPAPLPLLGLVLIGLLLTAGALVLPVIEAPGLTPIGALSGRIGSWGLLAAFVAVAAAGLVALKARPARASALLLGAAGVLVVRVLEYPLTSGRAESAAPGPGFWLALAAAAAFLASSAATRRR
ncbi:hypothetical protein GCM10022243_05750 [Saccharothrix violaceirubra]|uniref:Uncharacterized protein n=1 Tax=Saccharothrix violaceirubra TaxID=413306 RepID=A0A7W7T0F5_9PSEU|nr:hypothetical protein [Saccharothrix violaceirubra]MBB4962985.1 hypothetical protein [Saccharothrix violaceirubra]